MISPILKNKDLQLCYSNSSDIIFYKTHGLHKGIIKEIKRYLFMVLGYLSYASSLGVFLIPNSIVGGGVSGVASLIYLVIGLPAGIFIVLINAPILVFGFRLMGCKFIL